MHDLIIRSADAYDGTGQPRYRGAIAIANGPTGVGLRPRPRTEPVADLPGGAAPVLQRPTGIEYVIVNSEPCSNAARRLRSVAARYCAVREHAASP